MTSVFDNWLKRVRKTEKRLQDLAYCMGVKSPLSAPLNRDEIAKELEAVAKKLNFIASDIRRGVSDIREE